METIFIFHPLNQNHNFSLYFSDSKKIFVKAIRAVHFLRANWGTRDIKRYRIVIFSNSKDFFIFYCLVYENNLEKFSRCVTTFLNYIQIFFCCLIVWTSNLCRCNNHFKIVSSMLFLFVSDIKNSTWTLCCRFFWVML